MAYGGEDSQGGDPCHLYGDLYKYFLDEPDQMPETLPPSSSSSVSGKPPLRSMLVTGFGLRSWDSLERALLDDDQRKQMLLNQYDHGEAFECQSVPSVESSRMFTPDGGLKSSETETSETYTDRRLLSLKYLMGLQEPEEEEKEELPQEMYEGLSIEGEGEEKYDSKLSASMRKARKYLREHKIFEFFQFLISHMLAELPENPIDFLLDLLDKCLLYRSRFGNPPLLFEKPHLEQFFYVMDPMRTGFIELEQYKTGMRTLGICSYDKHPQLSTDGMVSKEVFVEEAYECLTDLFVEMIRLRGVQKTPVSIMTPPPTVVSVYGVDQ